MTKRLTLRDALIQRAMTATQESKQLDFKAQFEDTHECWCGLVKDIIAMANTGGGILAFGLKSDGTPSGFDCSVLMSCDISVITNKVFKWTNYEFAELETLIVKRGTGDYAALIIGGAEVPIPFTKRGEWKTIEMKKKTEFVEGTVYFRHGASSAPGTRPDFTKWIERYAAGERQRLMKGVRKMVAAPPGHVVAAVAAAPAYGETDTGASAVVARLSNDPAAVKIMPRRAADFHPHRGVELRERVNNAIKGSKLNAHDITSINRAYNVLTDHPEFATRPHDKASPQYSDQYVEWIVDQANADPNFVRDARNKYAADQKAKGVSYAPKAKRKMNKEPTRS